MSIQRAMAEHQVGTFQITMDCIEHEPSIAMLILAGCLVTQAHPNGQRTIIKYVAVSGDFDPVPPGGKVPQYTALIAPDADGDPPIRTWRRVSPPQS